MQRPYGPTFVSIPEDDWDAPADAPATRTLRADFTADPAALAAIAALFARSARPALVVGPGVDRDDACSEVVALAERLGAAVWVSPLSSRCSFPERHPQFSGFLAPVAASIARALAGHDAVLVLGAPLFTYHVRSDGPPIAPRTRVLQLTDDPADASSSPIGDCVVTTLKAALAGVLDLLPAVSRTPPPRRSAPPVAPATDPISGRFALQTLAAQLPRDAYVVEEAPTHRTAMHDYLPIAAPGTFFAAASGSLGWALPAAVGVALAAPGRRVVALLGDGSSLYSVQGLWTAAQLGLPVSFVVLDNGAYAAMNEFGRYLEFTGAPSFALPGLHLARCAEGFGCRGTRVERAADLPAALAESFSSPGPTLVDVIVDEGVGTIY